MRDSFLGAAFCAVMLFAAPDAACAQSAPATTPLSAAATDDVPLKPARSEFDISEFSELINNVLLVPRPGGPLPTSVRGMQIVHGRVLDDDGNPIVGAQVVLHRGTQYGRDFLENYDKTDELGRFVVRGNDQRTRILVRRDDGQLMRLQVSPGQSFALIPWPVLARIEVQVAPELSAPGTKIVLALRTLPTGLSAPRRETVLNADGTAAFDEVPPGDFRIRAVVQLKRNDGKSKYAEREIGAGTLAGGEEKILDLTGAGRIPVRGDAGPDAWCVIIHREETAFSPWPGPADAVVVNPDGTFLAQVPGPGDYCLAVNGEFTPRRFTVDETTRIVEMRLDLEQHPTVAAVHNILDSRMPESMLLVSYSFSDIVEVDLTRLEDRAGTVAELLRILDDPHAPTNWKGRALGALGRIVNETSVTEGLIGLLLSPPADVSPGEIFDALERADLHVPLIVDALIPYTRHETFGARWGSTYTLCRLVLHHPELKDRVAPALVARLSDPDPRIRKQAVSAIGWLDIKGASAELDALLADQSFEIRLAAARSLWQTTGASEPLLATATDVLTADDDDFEAKRQVASALDGVSPLPPAILDALRASASYTKKPPFSNHIETTRNQLAIVARELLKAHGFNSASRQIP